MKKALIIAGISVLTVILAIGGYGYYMYKNVESTVNSMHQTIDRQKSEKRPIEVDFQEKDPLSFLLLGIDARSSDSGRTDTIMVITVNPEDKSMKQLSIPRDTYTEIVGRGFQDKINHAYAFGGPEMTINTVENFLNIPIDYFVSVNMEGFKEIVDAVGGVTVDNAFAFRQSGYNFDEGEINLDGDQALAYSRMRKQDSRGDFGRNDRQRQVVNAIIEEGAQISSITRTGPILQSLGNNVTTNLTFDEMISVMSNYSEARRSVDTLSLSGSGGFIDRIWYYFIDENERLRVSEELRDHLNLDDDDEGSLVKADD
ncbi:LCP family protein [Evansella sp. AB-P1]|uniref:LCP family glycopolymer transferase n=1 Tax=Evansella sp. AB-P1 TaxID=3037653 RepID=UPI00241C6917|nr:LCP family protein [Evansella sp. AB-P1]MDG5789292.1 LCP family protein [Evansella sp. AB-P1]